MEQPCPVSFITETERPGGITCCIGDVRRCARVQPIWSSAKSDRRGSRWLPPILQRVECPAFVVSCTRRDSSSVTSIHRSVRSVETISRKAGTTWSWVAHVARCRRGTARRTRTHPSSPGRACRTKSALNWALSWRSGWGPLRMCVGVNPRQIFRVILVPRQEERTDVDGRNQVSLPP